MKFVFIDDNTDLGEVVNLIAIMKDTDCSFFPSALDALDYLASNKVDFIITDMNMPFCSGDKFVKKLRDMKNATPVIVSSGRELDNNKLFLDYGALKFVEKTALINCFDEILALVIHHKKRTISNDSLGKDFENILVGIV